MLYVDYNFHLTDNAIILDKELKLSDQENGNEWGNLPETWKEGDTFVVRVVNDTVIFVKQEAVKMKEAA
jgi:hypothetical protein